MKKIRDFKLRLHFKDIRHRARRRFDLSKMGLDDRELQKFLNSVEARMKPAVVYESFGADSEDTSALAAIKGLAHTMGMATLGKELGDLWAETREVSAERAELLSLVYEAALSQAVTFVTRLIKDEVEAERCELSPIQYFEDGEALKALFDKLDGGKIDLRIENGRLAPEHSAAFCLSWILKGRARKDSKASRR